MSETTEPLVLGAAHALSGRIAVDADLHVWGRIEGTLQVRGALRIEAGGLVIGDVCARRVLVRGELRGDLTALQAAQIEPEARVSGDIRAPRVQLAEGAIFQGRIEMGEVDPSCLLAPPPTAARPERAPPPIPPRLKATEPGVPPAPPPIPEREPPSDDPASARRRVQVKQRGES